ncbi:T9SS type A sorting domain-containing protein, partial [candidate division KSB1 bacterium]|nr:T9SS type A sorting domain-containing protein [candidate division KSB1 bacterium]
FIKPEATLVEIAEQNLPIDFELFQNYPNPFNSSTTIKYSLAENSEVAFKIYDVNGRLVDDIILNSQEQGEHEFRWTPKSLTSGVYLIKIQTSNWQKTIKAILLK